MVVLYNLKKQMRKIKWKIQRFNKGYSDCDSWDIFSWFLDIMPKILTEYKNNLHGCPYEFYDEKNEILGHDKWKKLIERLIFLLHEMNEDTCSYKNPYEEEFLSKFNEQFTDITTTIILSDIDDKYCGEEKNKWNYMNNCKKEFFELFSKYFYDLWD